MSSLMSVNLITLKPSSPPLTRPHKNTHQHVWTINTKQSLQGGQLVFKGQPALPSLTLQRCQIKIKKKCQIFEGKKNRKKDYRNQQRMNVRQCVIVVYCIVQKNKENIEKIWRWFSVCWLCRKNWYIIHVTWLSLVTNCEKAGDFFFSLSLSLSIHLSISLSLIKWHSAGSRRSHWV